VTLRDGGVTVAWHWRDLTWRWRDGGV